MELPSSVRVLEWLGATSDPVLKRLQTYADWLVSEAGRAGGIGPLELTTIDDRHIADSLVLAHAWRGAQPQTLVDLGSGVGLPGIPLAVVYPNLRVDLIERSGRRCRLLRRAVRILALNNTRVIEGDVDEVETEYDAVVSRAFSHPTELLPTLRRLTAENGVAVVAGSRQSRVEVEGFDTLEVPAEILDRPAWILIMGRH